MIARAKRDHGGGGFLVGDVVTGQGIPRRRYDTVVCVRTLQNLASLDEQARALETIASRLHDDGTLILAEGFRDGFAELDRQRADRGMPPLAPAPFNYYPWFDEWFPVADRLFRPVDWFHFGTFDRLTRVLDFDPARAAVTAAAYNPPWFAHLSRVRGMILRR